MFNAGSRKYQGSKMPRFRLEPLQDCRLAAALVLLMSFVTVSVLAGTEASRRPSETGLTLLQR